MFNLYFPLLFGQSIMGFIGLLVYKIRMVRAKTAAEKLKALSGLELMLTSSECTVGAALILGCVTKLVSFDNLAFLISLISLIVMDKNFTAYENHLLRKAIQEHFAETDRKLKAVRKNIG